MQLLTEANYFFHKHKYKILNYVDRTKICRIGSIFPKVTSFSIIGAVTKGGGIANLDAELFEVTEGASDISDVSVEAAPQLVASATELVNYSLTLATPKQIVDNSALYLKITGNTGTGSSFRISNIFVEIGG